MQLARHLSTESDVTELSFVPPFSEEEISFITKLADEQPQVEEWDGYDLDKTLATHGDWKGPLHIGEPIQPVIDHLKERLAAGRKVKIFTARVSYQDERVNAAVRKAIEAWCLKHIGVVLEVTCIKDVGMRNLFDDRAFHVEPNTGVIEDENAEKLKAA